MSLALPSAPLAPATLHLPARSAASQQNMDMANATPFSVNSTDLLRGQKAVEITHNGAVYRLQATRLGKLILTK